MAPATKTLYFRGETIAEMSYWSLIEYKRFVLSSAVAEDWRWMQWHETLTQAGTSTHEVLAEIRAEIARRSVPPPMERP